MFTLEDTAWIRSRIFFKDFINFMSLRMAVIFAICINSNQNTTLHTFNICSIYLRIDNNAPMCALGDTAWTRGRIFSKILSNFMNL